MVENLLIYVGILNFGKVGIRMVSEGDGGTWWAQAQEAGIIDDFVVFRLRALSISVASGVYRG